MSNSPGGGQVLEPAAGEPLVTDEGQPGPQRTGAGGVREQGRGHLALADLRAGEAPRHRHPVRGRDQVQLQVPVPARMHRALPVAGPSGQLAARAQQHLRHHQANQLRVGQFPWLAATGPAAGDHMIVDLDIQCDQESIQVRSHNRSWMPCSPSRQRGRRTSPDQELLIEEGAYR